MCRPKVSPDGDLITLALRTRKLAFDVAEDTGDVRLEHAGKTVSDPLLALDVIDLASATGPRLFPEDPVAETEVRIWLAFGASWHKEFNPLMEIRIRGHDNVRTDLSLDSAVKVLEGRLNQIEEHLKTRTWIAGEAFSLADAALYGKTSLLPKLGVQTADSRPRLAAWMKRVADATAS